MKLFDRKGNPVEVPDDQAHAAIASGQYGAPAGTQIPVRFEGKVGSVPIEKIDDALASGAEVIPQQEYEKADLQARYGDAGHAALAFGTSALDTSTLGLSNAVIGTVGGKKVRETLRKSEEANPVASGAGTAAGIIGPVVADVLSGGAATPAVAAAAARVGEKAAVRAGEKALVGAGEEAARLVAAKEAAEAAAGGEAALAERLGFSRHFAHEGGAETAAEREAWLRSAERKPLPSHEEARAREEWLREHALPSDAGDEATRNALVFSEPGGEAVEPVKLTPKEARARDAWLQGKNSVELGVSPDAGLHTAPGEAENVFGLGEKQVYVERPVGKRSGWEKRYFGDLKVSTDAGLHTMPAQEKATTLFDIGREAVRTEQAPLHPLSDVGRPLFGIGGEKAAVEGAAQAAEPAVHPLIAGGRPVPPLFGQGVEVAESVAPLAERVTPEQVAVAEAALKAPEPVAEAAAQVAGRGVIRQAVENSLLLPQRLVQGGGQLVEDVVREIVGKEAETALGRIAQKAVVGAARGAFEGGVYGVGNEVGHQFLQDDPELNGERLATAWVHGALLGGAFGGSLSVVGQGTREALTKAVGKEGVAEYLLKKSGEHMWHAAGPTQKMTAEANKYAGGAWKVGNLIREDAIEILGRAPASREELLKLAPQVQEKHNKVLDDVLRRLDDVSDGAERVKVKEIDKELNAIKGELAARAAPTSQIETFQRRIYKATGALDEVSGKVDPHATVSFEQLRNFRVSVDEMMKYPTAPGVEKAPDVALIQLRRWLEGRVLEAADTVANKEGGSLLADYKAAKQGYQAGKLLEKAAARGKAAEGTHQFFSLTDKLMSIPGTMIGHALAGPVGGMIGHGAAEMASKVVRKNFDFVVSDALAKLANVSKGEHVLNAAQKTAEQVQKRVDAGVRDVRKVLDGKAPSERPPASTPKSFEERRDVLLNAASQHEAVVSHIESVTKPLDKAAPSVAQALTSASLRTLSYLVDALPKPPSTNDSLTPKMDERGWDPSDQQKMAFNRQFDIATQPEMLLSLVASGEVTPDHVKTLKVTNPKMLENAQKKLKTELDRATRPVPPGMRSSAKLVLGVPHVDPSLGRMMQSSYDVPAPKKPATKPLKMTDNTSLRLSKD